MERRETLLSVPCEMPELHSFLGKLSVGSVDAADKLALKALALQRQFPFSKINRKREAGRKLTGRFAAARYPYPWIDGAVGSSGVCLQKTSYTL